MSEQKRLDRAAVALDELLNSVLFVSANALGGAEAHIDTRTGQIWWVSGDIDGDSLPDDLWDNEAYVEVPAGGDLNIGGAGLVRAFAEAEMQDDLAAVSAMLDAPDAFPRFMALADARGKHAAWHAFEASAVADAVRRWAAAEGIPLIEPGKP